MDRDRLACFVALLELAPLQHARHVVGGGELHHLVGGERPEPLAVEAHLGLQRVEDLEHLLLVGLGVRLDLRPRERRPRLRAPGGVADHAREVADHEHHAVPEVLEVLHLPDQNGVAEVQVGRRRVEADLDRERAALRELGLERLRRDDVHRPAREPGEGFLCAHSPSTRARRPATLTRPSSIARTARG